MRNILRPSKIIDRFNLFDADLYLNQNYKLILLDIDNTICPPDTYELGPKESYEFIDLLISKGFKVVLFSNNHLKRVKAFIGNKRYDYIFWAMKPFTLSYLYVMLRYKVTPSKIIVIGDQLLTDVIGGNIIGAYTIYSKKYQEKDSKSTSFNRKIERFIFKHIIHEEM